MEKFVNGDEVTDGTRIGVIADGFYFNDADDGTNNRPGPDMYPIHWTDGTQGYRHVSQIEYA